MIKAYTLLTLFCFSSVLTWSQTENLFKIKNNTVVFQKVITQPNLDLDAISDTIISFLENSSAANFTIDKKDSSTFSGGGNIRNTRFYGKTYSQLVFDYTIMIKDNRLKIVFDHILIGDLSNKTESINDYLIKSSGELKTNGKAQDYSEDLDRALQSVLNEINETFKIKLDASGGADDW
jgi:hypothetical protein